MIKASSYWQRIIDTFPVRVLTESKSRSPKQLNLKRFQGPGGALGLLTFVVAMWEWNWKLLFASSIAIGTMMLVYSMQEWNWQQFWCEVRKFSGSPNRRLALAVISGGIAAVSTYMAFSIWVDSDSRWIAFGAILQGLGTLLILILLVWQIIALYGDREDEYIEQLLNQLTDSNPLKRLIAVRRLDKIVKGDRVNPVVKKNIAQHFGLLLSQESESVIHEAVLDSLQGLEKLPKLSPPKLKKIVPVKVKLSNVFLD
ncbi:hypothetical protein [Mastigocoleus testarum]|uniref:Armadillo-type fold-containing protein n=1 Tax=Mastigocoleus testarum BC008 TaxID=371196 RepID=A0A0V7ZFK4_9CYAN|nr:hypothetical protein [Mastigocoleus testarum]KST63364.1 armadillo-type fold-containing protein [Mastigocoleus testarum BC008]